MELNKLRWSWCLAGALCLMANGVGAQEMRPAPQGSGGGAASLLTTLFGPKTELPQPREFGVRMEAGDLVQAKTWLDNGLHPDFMSDRLGSGVMIGAWEGNIALMDMFYARGADLNAVNALGEQALLLAAWHGKLEAVKWLLERGAALNRTDRQWTALHYAIFNGQKEVADYLMARGANINATSPNGSSVLMMAIYEGKEDLAKNLIERGADRSVRNDWGQGALDWAMKFNHTRIARAIATADEFAEAASRSRASWGEVRRSERLPADLAALIRARELLVSKGLSAEHVDRNIAALRARYAKEAMARANPQAASAPVLEVSASRKKPGTQSARLVKKKKEKDKAR